MYCTCANNLLTADNAVRLPPASASELDSGWQAMKSSHDCSRRLAHLSCLYIDGSCELGKVGVSSKSFANMSMLGAWLGCRVGGIGLGRILIG